MKTISNLAGSKIINTEELKKVLRDNIHNSNDMLLISAFLTRSVLDLFEEADYQKDIRIYVRCRPADCIGGSCDLEVLKQLISKGINCYADYKLHAKLYIFDSKQAVIGSSNLTANGLGFSNFPNFELNYSCELSSDDLNKVNTYLKNCVQLSIDDIDKMQEELSNIDSTSTSEIPNEWSLVDLTPRKELFGLFIEDFPKCNPFELSNYSDEDVRHDKVMFGDNLSNSTQFEQSNVFRFIYQFLETQENKSASFGAITAHLHSHILDNFSPYRREVKIYLQNLIEYLSYFECNLIDIYKYRYRQVLIIIKRKQ